MLLTNLSQARWRWDESAAPAEHDAPATPEDPAEFVAIGSLVTLTVAFLVLAGYWLVQCGECCFCSRAFG